MESVGITLIFILCALSGIAVDRLWIHYKRKDLPEAINPLPPEIPAYLGQDARSLLDLYMKEWEIVIQTQMHFNDLILRFRSMILTAFVTLIGAVIAIQKLMDFDLREFILILCLPVTLWVTAFIIDYGYYHRMLLGSVAQAAKFDNSELCKKYGLFGISSCIRGHVHHDTAKVLVILFYILPFLVSALIISLAFIFELIAIK